MTKKQTFASIKREYCQAVKKSLYYIGIGIYKVFKALLKLIGIYDKFKKPFDTTANNNNVANHLINAVANGDTTQVESPLKNLPDSTLTNKHQALYKRLLLLAAELGNVKLVKLLLNSGKTNIKDVDDHGNNALMLAARHGHIEVVTFLLSISIINVKPKNTNINIALEAKINVDQLNKYGKNALMLATQNKHTDIINLLNTVH